MKTPKPMREVFPPFDSNQRRNKISIEVGNEVREHLYDNDYGRIRGMTALFQKHHAGAGDVVEVSVLKSFERYRFVFHTSMSRRLTEPRF